MLADRRLRCPTVANLHRRATQVRGHQGQREANFGRGCPVGFSTKRIFCERVAWAKAAALEAAYRFAALVEEINQAHILTAPALNMASRTTSHQCHFIHQRIVEPALGTKSGSHSVIAMAGDQ